LSSLKAQEPALRGCGKGSNFGQVSREHRNPRCAGVENGVTWRHVSREAWVVFLFKIPSTTWPPAKRCATQLRSSGRKTTRARCPRSFVPTFHRTPREFHIKNVLPEESTLGIRRDRFPPADNSNTASESKSPKVSHEKKSLPPGRTAHRHGSHSWHHLQRHHHVRLFHHIKLLVVPSQSLIMYSSGALLFRDK